jgi:hypothetical protein
VQRALVSIDRDVAGALEAQLAGISLASLVAQAQIPS